VSQRVAGAAARSLARIVSQEAAGELKRAAKRQGLLHHLVCLAQLETLGDALGAAGVPWLVVKGPALAELAYLDAPRPYADLDIVVPGRSFGDALDALARTGGAVIDRNWDLVCAGPRGQLHLTTGAPATVDLHWHLVNLAEQRRRFRVPMDELFERRRTAALGQARAHVLEATDMLCHVALHATLSGGHQLGWLADVDRCVVNMAPDWDELVARSLAWRVNLPVAVALQRARRVLGAPVPGAVLDALARGPAGTVLLRAMGDWRPDGRLPGGGSIGRGVSRSLRDGLGRTAAAAWGEATAMVRRQVDHHEYWNDPEDPRNIMFPTGDGQGLARYLRLVAATDRFGH
jgi:hypothetical protein